MRREAALVVGLLGAVSSAADAADSRPGCVAKELKGASRVVRALAECRGRAAALGGSLDGECVARALQRLTRVRDRVQRDVSCVDDGADRLAATLGAVEADPASHLAAGGGSGSGGGGAAGSECQAQKHRAAGERAAAILRATAGVYRSLHAGSRSRRAARAQQLVRKVRKARRKFVARFARLEVHGDCVTTGDAALVGGAVDAALDAFAGALNLIARETRVLASPVEPANTPGSPGVVVMNPKLVTQFGAEADLNHVTYTRWYLAGPSIPDAVLILVPGFGGGAGNFEILAENLITRMLEDHGVILELWGYDRRTEQLEDRAGTLLAARLRDPLVALDWYYGNELGFGLHPELVVGPGRRALFYNKTDDVPFIANWTSLVFSRDIDVIVEEARFLSGGNVFLGGHSAGTGFAARYAATDLDLGGDAPDPGYAKLRGLVLLEGGGGSASTRALSEDALDRIIAKHDGGLFGAVRDGAPRCVDGTTPCMVSSEALDCAGQTPPKCTPFAPAHEVILGISPKLLAGAEPAGIQALSDPDRRQVLLQLDQGAPGNNPIDKVPELGLLRFLPSGTVDGLFGSFLDDDGVTAAAAPAFAASIGAPGPVIDGLVTWLDLGERASFPPCPGEACQTGDNGPAPTTVPTSSEAGFWGVEKEVVRLDRLRSSFVGVAGANASDWYYPLSGLGVTTALGVCSGAVCTAGAVGAGCDDDADCGQAISLDSTALSVGRGRRDIENLTVVRDIDVSVLAIGGSNGLTSVPGRFLPFAESIGPCAAGSCDGTARVLDAGRPSAAFPTFGGERGGFEVVIAEGFAHMDVVAAEDDAQNPIVAALARFIARNAVLDR